MHVLFYIGKNFDFLLHVKKYGGKKQILGQKTEVFLQLFMLHIYNPSKATQRVMTRQENEGRGSLYKTVNTL